MLLPSKYPNVKLALNPLPAPSSTSVPVQYPIQCLRNTEEHFEIVTTIL